MTTAEYLATPETVLPAELAFGVLRVAEAPTVSHQRMVGELFKALDAHVTALRLGGVVDRQLCAPGDIAPSAVLPDFELPPFPGW